jgi:hypothetical protein
MLLLPCPSCGTPEALLDAFQEATACPSCAAAAWPALELPFSANNYHGLDPAGAARAHRGSKDIVFTASAAVNYFRGDAQMPAAMFTGSAVLMLGQLTGQSAVAVSGPAAQLPVREKPEASFVTHLNSVVSDTSFVFELRGIRDRAYDVSIGTGPAPDERTQAVTVELVAGFRARGLRVSVNEPFSALPPWTVTSYAQTQMGLSAIQVQVSKSLRSPANNKAGAIMLFAVLRAGAAAAL